MAEPLEYPHKWMTLRFMFSDGKTLDVLAIHDSATVRGWVLEHMRDRIDVVDKKDYRIEGVAVISAPVEED